MANHFPVLIIPGLWNSGPEHWQSLWERKYPEYKRVNQRDWETPVCDDWIQTIDQAMAAAGSDAVLVAHSLGCVTIAHWAARFQRKIRGAMLVAPSDVEAPSYPPGTTGFVPMPLARLPFRTITVASSNDPYVSLERARFLATTWGSEFVDIGPAGHINTTAGFGPWLEGEKLLGKLLE